MITLTNVLVIKLNFIDNNSLDIDSSIKELKILLEMTKKKSGVARARWTISLNITRKDGERK